MICDKIKKILKPNFIYKSFILKKFTRRNLNTKLIKF